MKTVVRSLRLFISLLAVVVLFSCSLLADTKVVPTTSHDSWLDATNTPAAWAKGYTGKGVSIGIVDDSIDTNHPYYTLSDSFNVGAIYNNVNVRISETETMPLLEYLQKAGYGNIPTSENANDSSAVWDNFVYYVPSKDDPSKGSLYRSTGDAHGTCVTGCVAAYDTASETYGSSFNATLTGIRIDFELQSFAFGNECFATAVSYNNENIQLKNNSYGVGVGYLTGANCTINSIAEAQYYNTGLLYSAGNSRVDTDTNCADSNKTVTSAHPYTISVVALDTTDNYGEYTYYSNYGACVFICAPGESVRTSDRVDTETNYFFNTTGYSQYPYDIYQGYAEGTTDETFNGTSAASPVATGVLGLGIEAYQTMYPNKTCDVRYLKHMLARTSTKIDTDASSAVDKWTTNAAGLSFSHSYGFGRVNAGDLVTAIENSKAYGLDSRYNDVTEQTVATTQWVTNSTTSKTITSDEKLLYYSKMENVSAKQIADASCMTVQTVQSNANSQNTTSGLQILSADDLVYTFTTNFTNSDFSGANIIKQCLEEVVLTLDLSATGTSGYFDSRNMQITLEHGSTLSYLAFTETSTESTYAYLSDLQWSFSSNAFWGEDPLGEWIVKIYNGDTANPFNVDNLWTTFYMGQLTNTYYDASVESPYDWTMDGTNHDGAILDSGDTNVTHSKELTMSVDTGITVADGYTLEQTGKVTATGTPDLAISGKGTFKLNPSEAIDGNLGTVDVKENATLELAGEHSNLAIAETTTVDGTLEFSNYSGSSDMQLNNLSGSGTITGTNKDLTLDSDVDNPGIFDGKINVGTGEITKTGNGTLKIYSQADDYSDLTASSVIVEAGRLDLKGYYQGNVKVEANAQLSPGNSTGQLTVKDGDVTLDKGSQLILEIGGQGFEDNDRLDISGSLIVDPEASIILMPSDDSKLVANDTFQTYIKANNVDETWSKFFKSVAFSNLQFSVADGKLSISGTYVGTSGVPEPSTWALLIWGVAGLLWLKRSEMQKAKSEKA